MANVQLLVLLSFVVCCCGVNGRVVKRSDDVNLQVLIQQQAAVIGSLQSEMIAVKNDLHTLDNKVATLSKAVAFTAMFSTDDLEGIPLLPNNTLLFDRVITNAGNGYNPATGIFTTPVAGYYAFSIVLMEPIAPTHSNLQVALMKNNAVVDEVYIGNDRDYFWEQGSTHTVMHLAVGDQVWIRQVSGDAIRGTYWTVFTGYLVHVE